MSINRTEQEADTRIGINARLSAYADLDSVIEHLGGDQKGREAVTKVVNLYARQKGALVEWRDWFCEELEALTGFSRASHTEKRKGKGADAVERDVEVYDETEATYIDRFRKAVKNGQSFDLQKDTTIGPVPADSTELETWLQRLSNTKVFTIDATSAERQPKTEKVSDRALVSACVLLWNGSKKHITGKKAHWRTEFEKLGVVTSGLSDEIDPQHIEDTEKFDIKAANEKLATLEPEQVAKIKDWARAIGEYYKAKSRTEFA